MKYWFVNRDPYNFLLQSLGIIIGDLQNYVFHYAGWLIGSLINNHKPHITRLVFHPLYTAKQPGSTGHCSFCNLLPEDESGWELGSTYLFSRWAKIIDCIYLHLPQKLLPVSGNVIPVSYPKHSSLPWICLGLIFLENCTKHFLPKAWCKMVISHGRWCRISSINSTGPTTFLFKSYKPYLHVPVSKWVISPTYKLIYWGYKL